MQRNTDAVGVCIRLLKPVFFDRWGAVQCLVTQWGIVVASSDGNYPGKIRRRRGEDMASRFRVRANLAAGLVYCPPLGRLTPLLSVAGPVRALLHRTYIVRGNSLLTLIMHYPFRGNVCTTRILSVLQTAYLHHALPFQRQCMCCMCCLCGPLPPHQLQCVPEFVLKEGPAKLTMVSTRIRRTQVSSDSIDGGLLTFGPTIASLPPYRGRPSILFPCMNRPPKSQTSRL